MPRRERGLTNPLPSGQTNTDEGNPRMSPPAGWYDDPDQPGRQRYWDGEQWGAVAPPSFAPAAPTPRSAQPDTALFVIAWIVAVCTFGYFIPWAVAATRGMPNTGGVFVVNLLTGWTLIGWIIALVMACQQRH